MGRGLVGLIGNPNFTVPFSFEHIIRIGLGFMSPTTASCGIEKAPRINFIVKPMKVYIYQQERTVGSIF